MKINKRGSAPAVILIGMFLLTVFINFYLVIMKYSIINNERYAIETNVENSYRQNFDTYQTDFNKFCTMRDFINSNYKPSEVYVLTPVDNGFNIDEIVDTAKTALNSKPMVKDDVFSILDKQLRYSSQKMKLKSYLNSNSKNIYVIYKYSNKLTKIEKSFIIQKQISDPKVK